jgi:hypothetical protein
MTQARAHAVRATARRRKRGRPPISAVHASLEVGVTLTLPDLAALNAIAVLERISLPEVIRRAVALFLRSRARARSPRRVVIRTPRIGL